MVALVVDEGEEVVDGEEVDEEVDEEVEVVPVLVAAVVGVPLLQKQVN